MTKTTKKKPTPPPAKYRDHIEWMAVRRFRRDENRVPGAIRTASPRAEYDPTAGIVEITGVRGDDAPRYRVTWNGSHARPAFRFHPTTT